MFRKKVLFLMLTLLTIPVFVSAGNYSSVQSSAQVLPSSSVSKCQGDTALIRVPAEFVAANNAYQWFKTTNMAVPVSNEEKMVVEVNASKSYCLYVIDDTNDTLAIKYFVVEMKALSSSSIYVTACDNYTWFGNTYSNTTTATHTFEGANGCDSTVTLNLTIKQSSVGTNNVTVCDNYTWYGVNYSATTTATHTIANTVGCDSVVTLNLTIKNSTTGDTAATACDEFSWYGINYMATTTATHTIANTVGCDSVVTLNLTIKNSTTGDTAATACDEFSWYGINYMATTTATHTIANTVGCDSVVTLNLTIKNSTTGDTTATACNAFSWYGNNFTSSTETATHTVVNAKGCDSTITLHLTINSSTQGIEVVTACDSAMWYGTMYYVSTSTPTHHFANANSKNCDSTVTLHLTIHRGLHQTYTATACDSYTWDRNGLSYTTTGVYFHNYTSQQDACPSVDTLNLTINNTSTYTEMISACDSFYWHGSKYTASTMTPTVTLSHADIHSCDSVITLNLIINHPTTITDNIQACNQYVWPRNNQYYTQSNNTSWVYGGKDMNQCDTVFRLNLTVNQSNKLTQTETSCDYYLWNATGITYTTSGDYLNITSGAGECQDTTVLHLTINESTSGIDAITACDSVIWNGVLYYNSTNTPTRHFANANSKNCDSTVTLHLTIHRGLHQIFTYSACDSFIWDRDNMPRTSSGIYTFSYISQDGCISVDTLKLTIRNSTTFIDTISACDSLNWHGTTYNTTINTPTYILTNGNAVGCDSTITLNLTIHQTEVNYTDDSACDEYLWSLTGETLDHSGTYSHIDVDLQTRCNVIDTLHLIVNYSSHTLTETAECESLLYRDVLFTSSTDTVFTYYNQVGCESTDTLRLVIYGYSIPEIRSLKEKRHKGANNPWMLIYPRADNEPERYYQWYRNGAAIEGANKQYLQLPEEDAGNTVIYSVWVADNNLAICGSMSSDTITFAEDKSTNLVIYPNPSFERFTLTLQSQKEQAVYVEILNEFGVRELMLPMKNNYIDIDHRLPSGVYMVNVTTSDGNKYTDKVVIK